MWWLDFSLSLFFKPIKHVLKFECLSEFALQKYMWTHYSGHLGSSLTPRHFVLLAEPISPGICKHRGHAFLIGQVLQSGQKPAAAARRLPLSQLLLTITPNQYPLGRRFHLSLQQLIAPQRLGDVAGCLLSEGKSLFASPLALSSLPVERACLSLITREMVRRRGPPAEITQGDDQLWLMLFTFEGK